MADKRNQRQTVEQLAEEFAERYRRGERPPLTEYTARCPEHADEIRDLFPALVIMENVAPDDEGSLRMHSVETGNARSQPPQQLGDYRLIRRVGRGGMGVVYEAEQISLGRHVALKVLANKLLLDGKQKRRFEREAKAAAKLHHTNIVPVFGVGEQDGMPYYVMQFIRGLGLDEVLDELRQMQCEGGSSSVMAGAGEVRVWRRRDVAALDLARSLVTGEFMSALSDEGVSDERSDLPANDATDGKSLVSADSGKPDTGRLSDSFSRSSSTVVLPGQSEATGKANTVKSTYWRSVASIGVQIAGALEYAHKQGTLHRDVKPSNLLLDTHGTVWITDFGLAKTDDQQNLTHTGDILGTLRYMPPEAFDGKTDSRSDLYSLGLTLYEMLALQPAFAEKDRKKLIKQLTKEEPAPLRRLNPQVPRDLETIIHKAIDRDPTHRYQTARDFADDLQRFIDDEPIKARRIAWLERLDRWRRRNKGLATSLAAVAALLLVINVVGPILTWRMLQLNDELQVSKHSLSQTVTNLEKAHKKLRANVTALTQTKSKLEVARTDAEKKAQENAQLAADKQTEATNALAAKKQAEKLSAQLRSQLYQNEMLLAGFSREEAGGISRICSLTKRWLPTAPETDQRAWEWYYLKSLCHRDLKTLPHAGIAHNSVAFSKDGTRLATASRNGTAKIWEVRSGRLLVTLKGHESYVNGICWHPDGTRVATAGMDRTVRIWDARSGEQLKLLEGCTSDVEGVDWSPDGKHIAASQGSAVDPRVSTEKFKGYVRIWDAQSYKLLRSLAVHGHAYCVRWHPTGNRLAYCGTRSAILDLHTGKVIAPLNWGGRSLTWSPKGDKVALRTMDGFEVCDARTGTKEFTAKGHHGNVHSLAWAPDGRRIATASMDHTVKLWNAKTGAEEATIRGHLGYVHAVAWSPDCRRLASGGADSVKIWDPDRRQAYSSSVSNAQSTHVVWSPDGTRVASKEQGVLKIYAGDTWETAATIRTGSYSTYAWSPDCAQIAIAKKNTILIRDARTGELRKQFQIPSNSPLTLAWSPDAMTLAVGGHHMSVIVLEVQSGKVKHSLPKSTLGVFEAAWSPKGDRLATVCWGHLHVWDSATGSSVFERHIGEGWTEGVTWKPDGSQLAAATEHGNVRIYDASNGKELRILKGHSAQVKRVRWSPDGLRLASGGLDRTIRIWNPLSGRQTLVLKDHQSPIWDLCWSPDGTRLVSVGDDGMKLFDARLGYEHSGSPTLLSEVR